MHLGRIASLLAGLLLTAGPAAAQHHGGHFGGHVPVHHGIYFGHSNWNYVVPHHPSYVGAYYSVGPSYYYTPSPVVPVVAAPPVATTPGTPAAPPPAVEVQKPVELTFGSFARYQDLAGRLAVDANALCLDMHYNYQGNKNFGDVYGDAYGVLQAAKYLQGKEHNGDRDAIGKRVTEVHRLFHHVMDETRGWTRAAKKQVGTDTLEEKLAGVEAVLHHLAYDAGIKQEERAAGTAQPVVDPGEEAPPPVGKR